MYFGNEEENLIVPLNDIDEYKTEWSPKKSVDVSGTPGVRSIGGFIEWERFW